MRRAPLDADPVRQAMACIVDRDAITSKILKSEAIPLATIVPPWNPYFNSNTAAFPYDLTKAGEILDRAGYTVDRKTKMRIDPNTGKTMREMKILTPKAESSPPTMAQIGKMIADAARKVGLPVKHEPVDFLDMVGMVDDRNFDMYIRAWSLSRNPDYLESLFHSRNAGEGGYNTSGIALPELDQALEDLERAPPISTLRGKLPWKPRPSLPENSLWRYCTPKSIMRDFAKTRLQGTCRCRDTVPPATTTNGRS